MSYNNDGGLYLALETALKKLGTPQSCYDLYELAEVRKFAKSVTRVSDYLGNMWRKGQLSRVPAPAGRTQWLYQWRKDRAKPEPQVAAASSVLAKRPALTIIESGDTITLDFANLTVTIKQKA